MEFSTKFYCILKSESTLCITKYKLLRNAEPEYETINFGADRSTARLMDRQLKHNVAIMDK